MAQREKHRRLTLYSKPTIAERRAGVEASRIVDEFERPLVRGDCKDDLRPCPWVSCKHHLYLDVNPETGSIKLNFADLDVSDLKESCSLDVADHGGATLEEVGEILNLTRERIRQVEVRGLLKIKMTGTSDEPIPGDPDWRPPDE